MNNKMLVMGIVTVLIVAVLCTSCAGVNEEMSCDQIVAQYEGYGDGSGFMTYEDLRDHLDQVRSNYARCRGNYDFIEHYLYILNFFGHREEIIRVANEWNNGIRAEIDVNRYLE